MQKDGRVLYLTKAQDINQYWNIPIANTICLLLGNGTSITQAATRMLAQAGVLVGFCGSGGTPLLMASEVEWLVPQSEYRPTEYMQGWMRFWFDEKKRLVAAKYFQQARIQFLRKVWQNDQYLKSEGFNSSDPAIYNALENFTKQIDNAEGVSKLLQIEAQLTKQLYKIAATRTKYGEFVRERNATDIANSFLNHGNYLAYGLGATTLWVLGIPHGFAVMHGKTRRGALVFDIADLVKDALILPHAFFSAKEGDTEQQFRQECLQAFTDHKALEFMFNEVKTVALKTDWETTSP
jgi:CRISPR-associated protein Cas1